MNKVNEILEQQALISDCGNDCVNRTHWNQLKQELCEALLDKIGRHNSITVAKIEDFFGKSYKEENNTELSFSSKGIRSYFKSANVGDKMVIDGYQCAMMPDGKIWQIENMRGGDCLYTDNEYGSYYTWEQAKKVVPKGFKLPTKKDFDRLIKALGVKTGRELYESIWQGIFSGSYYNGLYGQGNNGYYWSSTALDSSDAYYLYLYDGYVGPGFSFGKTYGFAVRCLIKPDLFRE